MDVLTPTIGEGRTRHYQTRITTAPINVDSAPSMFRPHGDRAEFVPARVLVTWERVGAQPWEVSCIEVHGSRVLKSGAHGQEIGVKFYNHTQRGCPAWLADWACAQRPTD